MDTIQDTVKELTKRVYSKNMSFMLIAMLATGLGAAGNLYRVPKVITETVKKYLILQHLLMFVLIWQGGGGQDLYFSILGTFAIYVVFQLLYKLDDKLYPEPKPMQA